MEPKEGRSGLLKLRSLEEGGCADWVWAIENQTVPKVVIEEKNMYRT